MLSPSLDSILYHARHLIELAQSLIIIAQRADFITPCSGELILELQHIKTGGKAETKFFLLGFELRAGEDRGSLSYFHLLTGGFDIADRLKNLTRYRPLDLALVDACLLEQQILLLQRVVRGTVA